MKKKIISFILVLCLMAALMCGLTVSAFADQEDTIEGYWIPCTVGNGDTLYNMCAAKGVDYNAMGSLICSFSSIGDVRNLRAGMTVWLPVSDRGDSEIYYTVYGHEVVAGDTWYDLCIAHNSSYANCAAKIKVLNGSENLSIGAKVKLAVLTQPAPAPAATVTATATAAFPTTTAAASAAAATAKKEEPKKVDTSYKYLIPVTLASGDTVGAVCNKLESDFSVYSGVISQINGIASYNNLRVGQKLYIPTNKAPASGEYYRISEHTVVAGDALKDICKSDNVDLNASLDLIKAINPGLTNPGMIYVGQKLLIPVTVNGATESKAAGTIRTTTTAQTKSVADVSSIMIFATENGDVISTVNGVHKTVASEGTVVTLDITPEAGYKLSKITVNTYGTNKKVTVSGNSFVMPGEAVEVTVTFAKK